MKFQRIVVFHNAHKEHNLPIVEQTVDFLRTQHVEVTLLTSLESLQPVDLVISLGGDGTLLRCARACAPLHIPVFGINCGTLGFLASAEKDTILPTLQALLDGKCISHKRMMLSITVHQGERPQTFTALNDCVLHSSNMRAFFVHGAFNDIKMPSYFGDGVIIATPTGSTAYSLAAGGPIVEPDVEVFVVTPVCPHSLHERPMVLCAKGRLALTPSFKNAKDSAMVSFDGQIHLPLMPGARLEISRAQQDIELLTPPQCGFFSVLHKKLSWGEETC